MATEDEEFLSWRHCVDSRSKPQPGQDDEGSVGSSIMSTGRNRRKPTKDPGWLVGENVSAKGIA